MLSINELSVSISPSWFYRPLSTWLFHPHVHFIAQKHHFRRNSLIFYQYGSWHITQIPDTKGYIFCIFHPQHEANCPHNHIFGQTKILHGNCIYKWHVVTSYGYITHTYNRCWKILHKNVMTKSRLWLLCPFALFSAIEELYSFARWAMCHKWLHSIIGSDLYILFLKARSDFWWIKIIIDMLL